jgi:hypothetical protein
MLELLNGSGDLADRADQVTKCAQAAAAEALEASKEANNSSVESQAVPDLAMDQRANSVEEGHSLPDTNHQKRAPDGEANEPVGSSAVTPAWIAQTRLWNQWAMATQRIGQLYKANANPVVLNEAVARAREARINLEWDQRLNKAGLNRGEPQELTDEESDNNHCRGDNHAPLHPVCGSTLLLALPVNPAMPV